MNVFKPKFEGYTPFRTAVEGVEVQALVDYIPAGEDERGKYDHDADINAVTVGGIDIYMLCSESAIETIKQRFLAEKNYDYQMGE